MSPLIAYEGKGGEQERAERSDIHRINIFTAIVLWAGVLREIVLQILEKLEQKTKKK